MTEKGSKPPLPDGWLIGAECGHLAALAASAKGPIVEIGTYKGLSTCIMATATEHLIYTIDPHDLFNSWRPFLETLADNDLRNVIPYRMTSKDARTALNISLGGIYIDGDHSFKAVTQDISLWYPLLKIGGFLALHDYGERGSGVKEAVDTMDIDCENIELVGHLWTGIKCHNHNVIAEPV